MHLTRDDLRWMNTQIAADEILPNLERDIRRVVRRFARYRRDRQRQRETIKAVAASLTT